MAARERTDPAKTRQALVALADWLHDETRPAPDRDALASAVRLTARTLAAVAPGASVEVRIPPFVAVQCVCRAEAHPWHTTQRRRDRSADLVAVGYRAVGGSPTRRPPGVLRMSGSRAGEIDHWLPLFDVS